MSQTPSPEQLELRPHSGSLLVAGGFLGLCGMLTLFGGHAFGWCGVAFGVVSLFLVGWMSLSPKSHLRLSPEGFSFGTLRQVSVYRWTDVSGFFTTKFTTGRRVGFAFAAHYRQEPPIRWMSPPFHGRFLPNQYGMDAVELAKLLESWRSRYAKPA